MCLEYISRDEEFHKGWENQKYFSSRCFVWKRKVFDIIGPFDETFDFYAADADECNTLRRNAIYSVLSTKSVVLHEFGQTMATENKIRKVTDYKRYPITEWERSKGKEWGYQDLRFWVAV